MSHSGKRVLFGVTVAAAGVIYAVHYQQTFDRTEMHKGVLRDKARQAAKKKELREASQQALDGNPGVPTTNDLELDRLEIKGKQARLAVMTELEDESRRVVGSESRKGVKRR